MIVFKLLINKQITRKTRTQEKSDRTAFVKENKEEEEIK